MAATAHYVPIYREVLADLETPVSALPQARRRAAAASCSRASRAASSSARYSFVGAGPRALAGDLRRPRASTGRRRAAELTYDDPLELIDGWSRATASRELPGLPRFGGGAVGYLAYELARKLRAAHARRRRTTRSACRWRTC